MRRFLITIIAIFILADTISIGSDRKSSDKFIIEKTTIWFMNYNAKVPDYWKEVSVASRLNNPGNLRSGSGKPFRSFDNLADGYVALLRDIKYKQTGQSRYCDSTTTVRDFIYVYAPPFENNTRGYIKHLCEDLGINDTMAIGSIEASDLARAIIKIEDPILFDVFYEPVTYIDTIYYE